MTSTTREEDCRPDGKASPLKHLARSLRHRNFRIYFLGQGVSLIGTWMQMTAMSWLVYRLSGSAFLLGLVGFTSQLPASFLAPLAGVLVDRWDRRRLLIITQILSMVQALLLAVLSYMGVIAVWHIIVLSVLLGLVNAFDIPGRQSFLVEMLDNKEDLGNAIALQSSLFNGARLIGPSIAGLIIASYGEAACFFLNGISYAAIIYGFAVMRVAPHIKGVLHAHLLHELKEGALYTFQSVPIRTILMFLALASLLGTSFQALMPVFAKDILHGGPRTVGALMAAGGLGALVGAVYLAWRKNVLGLPKVIAAAATVFPAALIAFSFSRNLMPSFLLMMAAGVGMMVHMGSSNIIIQTITDDSKRGRVMSFYTLSFMGMAPFGSLLAGLMADHWGAPRTLVVNGAFFAVGTLIYVLHLPQLRAHMRPIYIRKGILPAPENVPPLAVS